MLVFLLSPATIEPRPSCLDDRVATGTSHHVAAIARRTLIASACLFPVYAALIGRHTDMHMALWGHTYLVLFYGSLLFLTLPNAGAQRLAFLRGKPAEFFARISYALYLVHTSILLFLSILLGVSRDVSTWPGRWLAFAAFLLSVALCWLSFKFARAAPDRVCSSSIHLSQG
jgi:peptidoglycan/LPS O-acetylase OafA/YrhL